MPVLSTEIKLYNADQNGNINTNSEITTTLFDAVLDIANDVEKKIFVKNTSSTYNLLTTRFYTVNGFTVNNTNGTPVKTADTELYLDIAAGTYTLTFPTVNSVVVTPPSGVSRVAQTIVVDGSTLNTIYLLDNLPIFLVFNTGLGVGNTATAVISSGNSYIYVAPDNSGTPGTYTAKKSYTAGVDLATIAAGQAKAVWLKQYVPDGVVSGTLSFIPVVRGDST